MANRAGLHSTLLSQPVVLLYSAIRNEFHCTAKFLWEIKTSVATLQLYFCEWFIYPIEWICDGNPILNKEALHTSRQEILLLSDLWPATRHDFRPFYYDHFFCCWKRFTWLPESNCPPNLITALLRLRAKPGSGKLEDLWSLLYCRSVNCPFKVAEGPQWGSSQDVG